MTIHRTRRHYAEGPHRSWLSAPAALLLGLLVLALPLLLPEGAHLARAVVSAYAISLAMKLRLLVVGDADPPMLARWPRVLIWLVTPQATWWPRSPEELVAMRATAPRQLARACGRATLMLAVVVVKTRCGLGERGLLVLTAFEMLQFYLLLAALADGVGGLAALAGIRSDPVFVNPVGARSPVEFWSCRWNLVVHRFAKRQIFLPIARRIGPLPALTLTFAASGLMHEYLVLASVGPSGYRPGLMLAFFALQALAVLASIALTRRRRRTWPRPLAAALHFGWLVTTCGIFFTPLRIQIAAFDATCLRVIDALLPAGVSFWC